MQGNIWWYHPDQHIENAVWLKTNNFKVILHLMCCGCFCFMFITNLIPPPSLLWYMWFPHGTVILSLKFWNWHQHFYQEVWIFLSSFKFHGICRPTRHNHSKSVLCFCFDWPAIVTYPSYPFIISNIHNLSLDFYSCVFYSFHCILYIHKILFVFLHWHLLGFTFSKQLHEWRAQVKCNNRNMNM